jgi:hypothetical protein
LPQDLFDPSVDFAGHDYPALKVKLGDYHAIPVDVDMVWAVITFRCEEKVAASFDYPHVPSTSDTFSIISDTITHEKGFWHI